MPKSRKRFDKAVFIGGVPRSGTTLLGSMLGCHPDCLTIPESQFITDVYHETSDPSAGRTREIVSKIQNHFRFQIWNMSLPDPVTSDELDDQASFRRILEWVVEHYNKKTQNKSYSMCIDHTPRNIRHAITLNQIFPDASFLHLLRDGRGVANSMMNVTWGPSTIDRAVKNWMKNISFGLALESSERVEPVMRVKYEHLLQSPAPTLKRICKFIDVDYTEKMVEGGGFELPEYTEEQHELASSRPVTNRATAWKDELSDREIEIFEYYAADLLRYCDYENQYSDPDPPSVWEMGFFHVKCLVMKIFKWIDRLYS